MNLSRREFAVGGAAAMALGFGWIPQATAAAGDSRPKARPPQGARNLVMLYLAGGNDALSFLVPYGDKAYYDRRPTQAVPRDKVLPVGSDRRGAPLGLHPNLGGVKSMFDRGHVAFIERVGYDQSSRSHFLGCDIMSTADRARPQGQGWLGRYLDTLDAPIDPLVAWNTQFQLPRSLMAGSIRAPSILDPAAYAYFHPWGEKEAAARLAASLPAEDPNLSFLNRITQSALATIDRVARVADSKPTVAYPETEIGKSLKLVASAIAGHVGSKIFWVQAAGYDTHGSQGTLRGTFARLTREMDEALVAFHDDLQNQGLLESTLVLQFSEFGRRIDENGSQGTDHGAAGMMMAMGGSVRGGIYGTAARTLAARPDNPDLENGTRDLRYDVDFRAVYARLLDDWLGGDSVSVLKSDYRSKAVEFI